MWKVGLFLVFFVTVWGESQGNMNDPFARLTSSIQLKNTLNYGDKCNFESEQTRQKGMKEYLAQSKKVASGVSAGLSDLNLGLRNPSSSKPEANPNGNAMLQVIEQATAGLMTALDSISKIHGNLCNTSQNLACLSSGTCGCAGNDMSIGYPLTFERVGDECVIKAGTGAICSPKGIVMMETQKQQQQGGGPQLSASPFRTPASLVSATTCPASERCLMKGGSDECTEEAFKKKQQEIKLEAAKKAETTGKLDISKAISAEMEGLCVCAGSGSNLVSFIVIGASLMAAAIQRF